ncbi:MAG: hypothetical protein V3573_14520 [Desulfovibrionaceae bacterium]
MEGLPKQVQEARAAADAIMAQFKPGDTSQQEQQAAPETKDTDVPKDTAPDAPPTLPDASEETWKDRFNAINGKYYAEVPRLAEQIRDLKARLQQAEQALHEKAQQAPPQPDPPTSVSRDALNEYDEEFGKMYDLVQAQQAKIDALQAVLDQVQGNVKQVHETQQQTEEQVFWRDLLRAVPDFDQLNGNKELGIKADPEFLAWLDGIDGLTKMSRRKIGEMLMQGRNVDDIKDFFNTFKASRKSKQPPQPPNKVSTEPPSRSTSTDAVPQPQQAGEIFPMAEVNELYRLRTIGQYPFVWRGQVYKSDAETKPICQELIRAGLEGRIQ